jgi:hypothetical protein
LLQRRLARLPEAVVKKVAAETSAPKTKLEEAVDAIAADVSGALAKPQPAVRRLRARS